MVYQACRECQFWVSSEESFCPNCGLPEPGASSRALVALEGSKPELRRRLVRAGGLAGTILGLSVGAGLGLASGEKGLAGALIFVGGVLGGLLGEAGAAGLGGVRGAKGLGASLGWLATRWPLWDLKQVLSGEKRWTGLWKQAGLVVDAVWLSRQQGRSSKSLKGLEDTISQRLTEFDTREKRILELRARVQTERGGGQWESLGQTLEQALSALGRLRRQYKARALELSVVRWENSLEPLAAGLEQVTHEEAERRQGLLFDIGIKGRVLLRSLEQQAGDTAEGILCVQRLKEALEGLEPLRQALVARQAVLAVQDLDPSAGNLPASPVGGAVVPRFDARAAVDAFSESFAQLEVERIRLQTEQEMARLEGQLRR